MFLKINAFKTQVNLIRNLTLNIQFRVNFVRILEVRFSPLIHEKRKIQFISKKKLRVVSFSFLQGILFV